MEPHGTVRSPYGPVRLLFPPASAYYREYNGNFFVGAYSAWNFLLASLENIQPGLLFRFSILVIKKCFQLF